MKHRLAAVATVVAAVLGALPAHAGLAPQITDATGDVTIKQPGYDIVSVTFDTTKSTSYKVVNKKRVKVLTPKDLTVTMALAGPVDLKPGTSLQVVADSTPCDTFNVYTFWSMYDRAPEHGVYIADCGTDEDALGGHSMFLGADDFSFSASGNKAVWTIPLRVLPKQLKVGSTFGGLLAYTAPAETDSGASTYDLSPAAAADDVVTFDIARSTKSYRLGS